MRWMWGFKVEPAAALTALAFVRTTTLQSHCASWRAAQGRPGFSVFISIRCQRSAGSWRGRDGDSAASIGGWVAPHDLPSPFGGIRGLFKQLRYSSMLSRVAEAANVNSRSTDAIKKFAKMRLASPSADRLVSEDELRIDMNCRAGMKNHSP